MKGKTGPPSAILAPVLDTFMDSAVALVGCRSRGLERYSCEYDVLVVTKDRRPPTSLRIGETFVDLTFVPERDVMKPANPEHALSLAFARPIRDAALAISTGAAANSAILSESALKASRTRLSSALKILGRADVALSRGALVDADLWLLAGSYELAYALLLSREVVPSPSHLLSQLRGASKGATRSFEGVSIGTGLEAAGRAGCGARLEGVAVLHDLLREGSKVSSAEFVWSSTRTEALAAKARELMTRIELAECYSFLGQELVDSMLELFRLHPKKTLESLSAGGDRLLGERLIRQIGLARSEKAIRAGLDALKGQVSSLAKKA